MSASEDAIAALCTGAGGAIAIIRISGVPCREIAAKVWRGPKLLPRRMTLGKTGAGEDVLAVFMPGPHSYTGEDVVELHCHGGAAAPKRLLSEVLRNGACSAEPGEFTRRAFVNGRMDLTQAEAVCDLISAKSASALALAERQASGLLGQRIKALRDPLLDLLAEVESRLDFPEENLNWKSPEELLKTLAHCEEGLRKLLDSRRDGFALREGVRVVIAGRPNVGKSSLLNALLGYDRAIVSPTPGTTRDTVEEFASLKGIPVRLTDTAGLRDSSDNLELLGVERTRKSLREAEAILWLLDASAPAEEELSYMRSLLPEGLPAIAVWNKSDLRGSEAAPLPDSGFPQVEISVKSGAGLQKLIELFAKLVWGSESHAELDVAVSSRHSALLESALNVLPEVSTQIEADCWELAAASLRAALRPLGEITGEEASPDVLDSIFSRFCIGK